MQSTHAYYNFIIFQCQLTTLWFSILMQDFKVWSENLVTHQAEKQLKLAPKLTSDHVNPTHFQKIRVKPASQVETFVSAVIKTCLHVYFVRFSVTPKYLLLNFGCSKSFGWRSPNKCILLRFPEWVFDVMKCRLLGNTLYNQRERKAKFLEEVCLI